MIEASITGATDGAPAPFTAVPAPAASTASSNDGWHPDLESGLVDRARIEDIAFTPMSTELRNRLITRTYGDLSDAMAEVLGTENATWTGFGQWASNSVGGFLKIPVPGVARMIGRPMGDGNRDVFADIARGHVIFLNTVGRAAKEGGDQAAAWVQCRRLLRRKAIHPPGGPGGGRGGEFWSGQRDPRRRRIGLNHNADLVRGFEAYHLAILTDDEETKARLVLAGNCLLGWHEQQLLSLAISIGLRSWLRTFATPLKSLGVRRTWRHHEPSPRWMKLENWFILFATRFLMATDMPWGRVRLGRALTAGDRPIFDLDRGDGPDAPTGLPCYCDEPEHGHAMTPLLNPRRRFVRRESVDDGDPVASILTELDWMFEDFCVDGGPARCWNHPVGRTGFIMALFSEHQRWPGWFDESGRVARPTLRRDLDPDLARLRSGLRPPPKPLWPESRRVHLSEERLDQLRRTPSQPEIEPLPTGVGIDVFDLIRFDPDGVMAPVDAALDGRLEEATELFLDPESCRLTRGMFRNWTWLWLIGHICGGGLNSLTQASTARMLGRLTRRRGGPADLVDGTAQFVTDLMIDQDGWDQGRIVIGGPAHRSLLGLRSGLALTAAGLTREGWHVGRNGAAVSQESLLGAVLSTAIGPIRLLDRVGVRPGSAALDRHVRFWLGIGYLLGAPLDALTVDGPDGRRALTLAEAEALADAITLRDRRRTLHGVRLAEAAVMAVADGFLRTFVWLAPGLVSALGDRSAVRTLMIDQTHHRFGANTVAAGFRLLLRFSPTRMVVRAVLNLLGRHWFEPIIDAEAPRSYRRLAARPDTPSPGRLRDPWPEGCSKVGAQPRPVGPPPRSPRRPGGHPAPGPKKARSLRAGGRWRRSARARRP